MKYSLSILASALVLAGCITNPSNKQSAAEPTATTAPAVSSTQAAPAGTAATPAATGADVPCTPAASTKASATAKKRSAKKTRKNKSELAAAPAAAPCAAAAGSANAANKVGASGKDQPASQANANRKEVKGINDWSGYVQGTPARNSKFAKLKIGMGEKEVTDLIGAPTDQSMHMTGKAWIPFYVGSGKREVWYHYKGVGRLLFADNAGFTTDTGLIGIEHDPSERGYK